eukprot:m.335020 g.335020  ORF g.335020 m.335020 type:complete len:53 (-) comp20519_c0_seq2:2752-2910(-)
MPCVLGVNVVQPSSFSIEADFVSTRDILKLFVKVLPCTTPDFSSMSLVHLVA